ncbi:MAG: hypothetical protein EOP90_13690 [Lysobacteraceae bacterium]|nr:MAG: hypothetical protein EOP90_13690 [Xanthomonadaceae bacterium]
MQTKASTSCRWSRWPAIALATLIGTASPLVHASDAELVPDGPAVTLRVLMSIDPLDPPIEHDPCGTVGSMVAYTGENVRWCYRITNNTDVPLTRHTLESDRAGTILSDFPFTLVPGASAFITRVEPITESVQETATWRASTPDTPDDYSDDSTGTLTVRSGIEVVVTASMDPVAPPPGYDECGTQNAIEATPGRTVRWCYTVRNVSSIPRTRHTVVTSQNGTVIEDFPFTLVPGASAFLTQTQVMDASALTEVATWTAFRTGPEHLSTATATGRVLAVGDAIFMSGFE